MATDLDEVGALTREVGRAWAASDVDRLRELLADDYTHVDIYGRRYDRDGWLRYAEQPRSPGDSVVHDEDAYVLGDTAVVTSCVSFSQIEAGSRVQLIHVWVRTPHGWRRRWYQATLVQQQRAT